MKDSFYRYFLTLMAGSFIAQCISFLSAPLLSRIFSPEDFGIYGIFWSIILIANSFSTGKFEIAILLPKKESEGRNLAKAAIIISLAFCLILCLAILFFLDSFVSLLGLPKNALWLYLVPVTLVLLSLSQVFYYWSNRKKLYNKIASFRIVTALSAPLVSIPLGLVGWRIWGLITGQIIGLVIGCIILSIPFILRENVQNDNDSTSRPWRCTAAEYFRYPAHMIPYSLLYTLAQQLPILLLGSFFGIRTAGLFYFSYRIINLPITLIGGSLADVFYKYSMENIEDAEKLKLTMEKSVAYLFLIAIVPSVILLFFGSTLFTFIFGPEWRMAGTYTQILIPFFFMSFLSSPLMVFYQKGLTIMLLKWQAVFFLCVSLSLIGGKLMHSPVITIATISLLGALCYSWLLIINFRLTGSSIRNIPRIIGGIFREIRHG